MSQKKNELPSLRKTPLDFLSRDEARQAVKSDVVLDASEAAEALGLSRSAFYRRLQQYGL